MFGLLNPFILWLAPLLAGPLIIHFLGRAEPKVRDFPSLLPVRGQLMRAMQRHRLKNWLQLILRTLVLLCLLLAAANLVWRSPSRWTPPETTALLVHNGIYGAVPASMEAQQRLLRGLDSLAPGRNLTERVVPEAPDARPVARFGRYPDAVARLLRKAGAGSRTSGATPHVFLPLFDARDLDGLGEILKPWLERHPRARVALIDYTGEESVQHGLSPFVKIGIGLEKEGQVALRATMAEGPALKPPLWVPENGAARETRLADGTAEIILPLPESGDRSGGIRGSFAPAPANENQYAQPSIAVSYRIPPPATFCVLSPPSAWLARATLGEGGKRLKVLPLTSGAELGAASCNLLYLADPENLDATVLARAVAVLRAGGKVIVGTGRHADVALLNRNLLQPLGVGRLTGVETHVSLAAQAHEEALAKLGLRANAWGRSGAVRTHLGFQPEAGTIILLSARKANTGGEIPLLLYRRVAESSSSRAGELLLWTTDIGDPEWSDIGLGPWAALMHQAFAGRAWAAEAELQNVASDSTLFIPVAADDAEPTGEPESEGSEARLRDPAGRLVPLWRPEPGGGRAGPFDRTGLYRLESARDTVGFAVNLASERLEPLADARQKAAWKGFYATLGTTAAAQTERVAASADWRALYGGFRLRLSLLILAALLLFAEGLVSLRLSPSRD